MATATATTHTSTLQKFSVQQGTGKTRSPLLTRCGAVKTITRLVRNVIVCMKRLRAEIKKSRSKVKVNNRVHILF